MIYLYAIVAQYDPSLDPPLGVENQGVYQINCNSFTPVVSTTLTTSEIPLSKEAIYQHEKVVEFYFNHTTVLPVRFNALFNSEEELLSNLKNYKGEIETNLRRVHNCVEIGLKILAKDKSKDGANGKISLERPLPKEISKAKKYLLDKFSGYKEAFYLQDKYKTQVEVIFDLLKEYSCEGITFPISANSSLILNSVFLVNKDSLNNFKSKFQGVKQNYLDFAFLLSGPWPPYSFVDLSIRKNKKEDKEDKLCLS